MASEYSSANDSVSGASPGKILSKKRKSKKLDEREVAEALKISVNRLRSIENDDLAIFPSETYIRGHLKNYSRLLGCEELVVLEAYDSIRSELGINESSSGLINENQRFQPDEKRRAGIKWILLVFIIAVAAVVAFWLLGSKPSSAPEIESNVDLSTPELEIAETVSSEDVSLSSSLELQVVQEPEPVTALIDAEAKVEKLGELVKVDTQNSELIDDAQAVVSEASSSPASTPKTTPETPIVVSKLTASELVETIRQQEKNQEDKKEEEPVGDALIFSFNDASWVQVIDAEKKTLFKGLNKPNAKLALNGSAPFNIVIGNVNGTSLVFNGEPVVLTAPVGKNILRLTLGE